MVPIAGDLNNQYSKQKGKEVDGTILTQTGKEENQLLPKQGRDEGILITGCSLF